MMSQSPFSSLKSLSCKLQLQVFKNKVFSTMHHNLISQLLAQGKQYSYFTSNFQVMSRVLHFTNSHFKKNSLKQEHLLYDDGDRRGFMKKHSQQLVELWMAHLRMEGLIKISGKQRWKSHCSSGGNIDAEKLFIPTASSTELNDVLVTLVVMKRLVINSWPKNLATAMSRQPIWSSTMLA